MFDSIESTLRELGLTTPSREDVENRRWTIIVDQYEAIDRWRVFGAVSEHLRDEEYGAALRHIWTHSEGDFDEIQFDAVFFPHGQLIEPEWVMTDAERQLLDSMADPICVYRGCQEDTREGVCWTTDLEVAREFARRAANESQAGEGIILKGECSKADVIAFFDAEGFHESEILTKQVSNSRIHERVSIEDDE